MPLTGVEVIRILERNGWIITKIKGSHYQMRKDGYGPVTVPRHNKDMKLGTLMAIEKATGIKLRK